MLPVTNHQPTPGGRGSSSRWTVRRGTRTRVEPIEDGLQHHTRTRTSPSEIFVSKVASGAGGGPALHGAAAVVASAMTWAQQLLRAGVPADAASEVRARGVERRDRGVAGANQEHRAPLDHLGVAVLTGHSQHDGRGHVGRERDTLPAGSQFSGSPGQARREHGPAQDHSQGAPDGGREWC